MKENKRYKKENGITLIALVVTIVILLILASVSIAMLTGENRYSITSTRGKKKNRKCRKKRRVNIR